MIIIPVATTKYCHGSLDVYGCCRDSKSPWARGWRSGICPRRRGMHPNEGGDNLHDRRLIDGGVTHDAFKGVQRPEAYIDLVHTWLPKLIDGLGEPVCDLSCCREVLLSAGGLLLISVGCVGDEQADAEDDHREDAAEGEQPLPGIGFQFDRRSRRELQPHGLPAVVKPPVRNYLRRTAGSTYPLNGRGDRASAASSPSGTGGDETISDRWHALHCTSRVQPCWASR